MIQAYAFTPPSVEEKSKILLKTFLYFAVFKFPLTKREALAFCQFKTQSIDSELDFLLKEKLIYKIKNLYLPKNEKLWVERRLKGHREAKRIMPKAKKMAHILKHFPFVRSIMISGTLAKGYMDQNCDIDFFVITKPGNITISKFLIGVSRRLFFPKGLCVNYIIDTDNLLIEKQNIYSATEFATLIPVMDSNIFHEFISKNKHWVTDNLPNYNIQRNISKPIKEAALKISIEKLLSTKIGNFFETRLQKFYLKKLSNGKKEHKESFISGELKIKKGVIKGHNLSYEKTILGIYNHNKKMIKENSVMKLDLFFYD